MSTEPDPSDPPGGDVPRPPAHAWRWLQRSRPVLRTVSERLTGGPPPTGFVDELRRAFDTDPFTRTIVIDVIAEIAFGGRVPQRQPAGASWDRGLRWWAAALAGVDVAEFDGPATAAAQPDLFDSDAAAAEPHASAAAASSPADLDGGRSASPQAEALVAAARRQVPRTTPERLALARTLRELAAASEDGHVPASVVRQLIDELEGGAATGDDETDGSP